jgi:hypothetical protein
MNLSKGIYRFLKLSKGFFSMRPLKPGKFLAIIDHLCSWQHSILPLFHHSGLLSEALLAKEGQTKSNQIQPNPTKSNQIQPPTPP